MLQGVVEHCEAAGFVLVMAWPADDAYRFYERHGFERQSAPLVHRIDP